MRLCSVRLAALVVETVPIGIAFLTALLLAHEGALAEPRWQLSQSPAVRLSVRDFDGTLGQYSAMFVVKDAAGKEYRVHRTVAAGGHSAHVHFPEDFSIGSARVGRHQWVCLVGGRVVAGGAFEYLDREAVKVDHNAMHGPRAAAQTTAIHGQRDARIAKAQADVRAILNAVSIYGAHMGRIPATLAELTQVVRNAQGATAGPFLQAVPSPPPGWSGYIYSPNPETGMFSIVAAGDGTAVKVP